MQPVQLFSLDIIYESNQGQDSVLLKGLECQDFTQELLKSEQIFYMPRSSCSLDNTNSVKKGSKPYNVQGSVIRYLTWQKIDMYPQIS